jgi:hypothetical protein
VAQKEQKKIFGGDSLRMDLLASGSIVLKYFKKCPFSGTGKLSKLFGMILQGC